jgi:hypothetical protein
VWQRPTVSFFGVQSPVSFKDGGIGIAGSHVEIYSDSGERIRSFPERTGVKDFHLLPDERAYLIIRRDKILCFDYDGKLLWEKDQPSAPNLSVYHHPIEFAGKIFLGRHMPVEPPTELHLRRYNAAGNVVEEERLSLFGSWWAVFDGGWAALDSSRYFSWSSSELHFFTRGEFSETPNTSSNRLQVSRVPAGLLFEAQFSAAGDYQLETSVDLKSWRPLLPLTNASSNALVYTGLLTNLSASAEFFRAAAITNR